MEFIVLLVVFFVVVGMVKAAFDGLCSWADSNLTPEQRAARDARRERYRIERERERDLAIEREHQKKLYEMQLQAQHEAMLQQKKAASSHFKHKLAEGAVHLAMHALLGKHGRR